MKALCMTPGVYVGKGVSVGEDDIVALPEYFTFRCSPDLTLVVRENEDTIARSNTSKIDIDYYWGNCYGLPLDGVFIINDEKYNISDYVNEDKTLSFPDKYADEESIVVKIPSKYCTSNFGLSGYYALFATFNGVPSDIFKYWYPRLLTTTVEIINIPSNLKQISFTGISDLVLAKDHEFEGKYKGLTTADSMFAYSGVTQELIDLFDYSEVTDCSYMFARTQNTDLDLSKLNTVSCTSLDHFLYNSTKLEDVNSSGWVTGELTNIGHAFTNLNVPKLDLNGWNIGGVTGLAQGVSAHVNSNGYTVSTNSLYSSGTSPFVGLTVNELLINKWECENELSLDSCFYQLSGLKEIKLGKLKITSLCNTFYSSVNKDSLITIDMSNCDLAPLTTMDGMCYYLTAVSTIKFPKSDTSLLTTIGCIFGYPSNATEVVYADGYLNNVNFDALNLDDVKIGTSAFLHNKGINGTKLVNMGLRLPNLTAANYMFYNSSIDDLDFDWLNKNHTITDMSYMFGMCKQLNNITFYEDTFKSCTTTASMFSYVGSQTNSVSFDLSMCKSETLKTMSSMFSRSYLGNVKLGSKLINSATTNLSSIFADTMDKDAVLDDFMRYSDTSSITTMYCAFGRTSYAYLQIKYSPEYLYLPKCTDISYMFGSSYNSELSYEESIVFDFGEEKDKSNFKQGDKGWYLPAVTTAKGLFQRHRSEDITFKGWLHLPKCTSGNSMFYNTNTKEIVNINCDTFTDINLMYYNALITSNKGISIGLDNVTSSEGVFSGCSLLTDIREFYLPKSTRCGNFYSNCNSLVNGGYVIAPKAMMTGMFSGCSSLKSVKRLVSLSLGENTRMFQNCTSLEQLYLNDETCLDADGNLKEIDNLTSYHGNYLNGFTALKYPVSGCTELTHLFYPTKSTSSFTMEGHFVGTDNYYWFGKTKLLEYSGQTKIKNMTNLYIDWSKVKQLSQVFEYSLESGGTLDFENIDLNNLTSFSVGSRYDSRNSSNGITFKNMNAPNCTSFVCSGISSGSVGNTIAKEWINIVCNASVSINGGNRLPTNIENMKSNSLSITSSSVCKTISIAENENTVSFDVYSAGGLETITFNTSDIKVTNSRWSYYSDTASTSSFLASCPALTSIYFKHKNTSKETIQNFIDAIATTYFTSENLTIYVPSTSVLPTTSRTDITIKVG